MSSVLILWSMLYIIIFINFVQSEFVQENCDVLREIYWKTGGPYWYKQIWDLNSTNCCKWDGIFCEPGG